ncbi:hypothetical protein ACKWTF_004866 [Chironomus riparius]
MNEIMDIRLHQHLAQELYRQQMLQRIPDPYASMFPARQLPPMPPRFQLPGADVKLQNQDLWSQFHKIGTEMIITKSGRRMFPSLRISLAGLDNDQNYCVLLEMAPTADCRFKFSGSQWVPAGGAEPQSLQNIYIHPDSPALGSHWQAQPINFNKVKLTNNTLDSSGHVVLTSMHKYQPRIHIVRTSDPSQIPWSPQKSFVFHETEFVAVTAYQNDRITKLKIDNNPFAKGFRETGQSRCKRKLGPSTSNNNNFNQKLQKNDDESSYEVEQKRLRVISPSAFSAGSLEDSEMSTYETSSNGSHSPATISVDDCHSPVMKPNIYPYTVSAHNYHHMVGPSQQWLNFMMPYINTEHQAALSSNFADSNSSSPSTSPSKSISISFSDNEESPKKCNFSIASILGL